MNRHFLGESPKAGLTIFGNDAINIHFFIAIIKKRRYFHNFNHATEFFTVFTLNEKRMKRGIGRSGTNVAYP
jgi:hypothetical protein